MRRAAALCLALTALVPPGARAQQQHDITGTVVGADGQPASGAMVVALALPDSVLTRWATTGGDGAFSVGPLSPGDYLLQVTLIGHQTVRNPFSITDSDVSAGSIGLEVLAVEVEDLVVSVEHVPFLNRRDTLAFNALAFEVRPNATVEDLLRRLPGIEVGEDGTITAQGEQVQNVLVDGREFFGDDPSVATNNLPADAVERVEVYDRESDTAEFTGIPDGQEERTINLELREDARRGFFGDFYGGFGAEAGDTGLPDLGGDLVAQPEDRVPYDGRLNLNRFSPTTQLAIVANAGNVARPGFRGGGGGRGFGGGGGSEGLFENLGAGLNASHDFTEDTWLRSSYFFGSNDLLRNQTVDEERLLGSEVGSLIQGLSQNDSGSSNHNVDLNSQIQFAEGHDIRIRGDFQAGLSNSSSASIQNQTVDGERLNSAITNYDSDDDEIEAEGRLTWRKRLNDSGRSLIAEGRLDYNDTDERANLESIVEGTVDDPLADANILQDQLSVGETLTNSVRLSWTEPLSQRNVLEFFGERRAIDEDEARTVFDLDEGSPIFNPVLSSAFNRTYTYWSGGLRFSRNTDATRLVFGLEFQNSDLEGAVLDPELDVDPVSNGFTHFLPQAELRVELSEGKNVRLRYNTSTREPSITEFQPYANNDDPLNVYVGNPDLNPEYRHRLRGEYRLFDQFSFMNLFTYASVDFTKDNIAQSRFVDDSGRQVTTPRNTGSAWSTNLGVNFGTPIRSLGTRVSLDYRLTYANETAFVNDEPNDSHIVSNGLNAIVENRDKSLFDVRAGGGLSFNNVSYSLNDRLDENYINPNLFAEGSLYLGQWEIGSNIRFQGYDEDVFGPGLDTTIWEATVKRLIMNDRAEIELGGYDLLNENKGISVTNTSSFNRTQRVQSLGRHVMLRFSYRLGIRGGGGGGGDRFRGRRR
ncbi:MAG: TonB-dependent receptor [Gemmatimonadota bacterium]|nr:TonB-dependent receptor [Gemmatimonadota bacterium]